MIDTQAVFAIARKHLGKGEMESSARVCLADAMRMQEVNDMDAARRWAIRSIAYSVGILHADYRKCVD